MANYLGGTNRFFLGPAWTLCYEEQFYFVVGLLLLSMPRRFFAGVAAITVGVLLFPFLVRGREWLAGGWFADGQWLIFAAGVTVYFLLNFADRRRAAALLILLAAGSALGGLEILRTMKVDATNEQTRLFGFGFALTLYGLHRHDRALADWRPLRPLAECGLRCYSVYLVHWPIVKAISHAMYLVGFTSAEETLILTVPLCLFATLVAAWGFHSVVERRFLSVPGSSQLPAARTGELPETS